MSAPKAKKADTYRLKRYDHSDAAPEAIARNAHAALEDIVEQLNAKAAPADPALSSTAAWAASLPIGIPLPLPMHLYPTDFALPDNVLECAGGTVDDRRSILYGKTLDDLNGGGYFIRGGTVAGTVQADQVKNHVHDIGHTHEVDAVAGASSAPATIGRGDGALGVPVASVGLQAFAGNSGNPTAGGGTETRPKNVSHVYVIRIF